jgi:phage baseplate assembly protein W
MPIDGIGLLLPFQRDGRGDFASGLNEELYASAIELVLLTAGETSTTAGELPWRGSFGVGLDLLRLRPNSIATAQVARQRVDAAMKRWMPEVEVLKVNANPVNNKLSLLVFWKIRGENTTREPISVVI